MIRMAACYTIGDRVKYISHLDLQRTIQRTVRRAGIPVAYSEGFNPHPKIAYASALSVGLTSSAEYMDLILREHMDPADFVSKMNEYLPKGFLIKDAEVISFNVPSLMSLVEMAEYSVCLPEQVNGLPEGLSMFLGQEEILYEKQGKKSKKVINIKDGIYKADLSENGNQVIALSLSVGKENSVKPEAIIRLLFKFMGLSDYNDIPININREGLYAEKEKRWITLLEYCRGLEK